MAFCVDRKGRYTCERSSSDKARSDERSIPPPLSPSLSLFLPSPLLSLSPPHAQKRPKLPARAPGHVTKDTLPRHVQANAPHTCFPTPGCMLYLPGPGARIGFSLIAAPESLGNVYYNMNTARRDVRGIHPQRMTKTICTSRIFVTAQQHLGGSTPATRGSP